MSKCNLLSIFALNILVLGVKIGPKKVEIAPKMGKNCEKLENHTFLVLWNVGNPETLLKGNGHQNLPPFFYCLMGKRSSLSNEQKNRIKKYWFLAFWHIFKVGSFEHPPKTQIRVWGRVRCPMTSWCTKAEFQSYFQSIMPTERWIKICKLHFKHKTSRCILIQNWPLGSKKCVPLSKNLPFFRCDVINKEFGQIWVNF